MLQMESCDTEDGEFDVIPPLHSVTITLDVSPTELELAVATSGKIALPGDDECHHRRDGGRYDVAARAAISLSCLQFSLSAFALPIAAGM